MPIYEYECLQCGRRTERLQRVDDPPLAACPHCGGPVKKLLSAPAFQFKGSGWYVTDYAGRGKTKPAEGSEGKGETAGKGEEREEKAAGAEKGVTTGGETAKTSAKEPGGAKSGGNVSSE